MKQNQQKEVVELIYWAGFFSTISIFLENNENGILIKLNLRQKFSNTALIGFGIVISFEPNFPAATQWKLNA